MYSPLALGLFLSSLGFALSSWDALLLLPVVAAAVADLRLAAQSSDGGA